MILRPLCTLLAASAAFGALSAPAFASDADWGAGVEVMGDSEMGDLRGGFQVGGIEVEFGAVITTYLDGAPVLSTMLTITDAGREIEHTLSGIGQHIDAMTPDERSALGLEGLKSAGGLVIEDDSGVTTVVHNVTDNALQNIIINSASGRELRQEIDLTLTLPGFDAVQDGIVLQRLGIHLADDMVGFEPGA